MVLQKSIDENASIVSYDGVYGVLNITQNNISKSGFYWRIDDIVPQISTVSIIQNLNSYSLNASTAQSLQHVWSQE